jgi:hypothetical protein
MYIMYQQLQYPLSGPKTFLGTRGKDILYMQPYYTKATPANTASIKLKFFVESPSGRGSAHWFNAGQAIGIPDVLSVGYYARSDRREVFISMEVGAVSSFLLDFDGKRIHVLYSSETEPESGRIRSFPTWDDTGRFAIREMYWLHGPADRKLKQIIRTVYPKGD